MGNSGISWQDNMGAVIKKNLGGIWICSLFGQQFPGYEFFKPVKSQSINSLHIVEYI